MPRKMSDRWLAANKENAQKSTGPKTPEGKARSAQNARSHGILANEVVIKKGDGRERTAEFEDLLNGLHAQFRPQDAVEHVLVDRVAACYWRLRRAQRFEVGAVREELDDCKIPPEGPGPNMKKHEATVSHWRMVLNLRRQFHQESLKGRQSPALRSTAAVSDPAPRKLDDQPGAGSDLGHDPVEMDPEDRFAKAEEALREYESLTQIAKLQDARFETRRPLLGAIPSDEYLHRLVRYETMLDRQLHRALAELGRRQQRAASRSAPAAEPPVSSLPEGNAVN